MANYVELREFLSYPAKYVDTSMFPQGDVSHIRIQYYPNHNEATFQSLLTGVDKDQKAKTEIGHIWHPFIYRCNPYIITENETKFRLDLQGEQGYIMGLKALSKYAKLYEDRFLETHGIALNEEMFDNLPHWLKFSGHSLYWIATKFCETKVYKRRKYKYFGFKESERGIIGCVDLYSELEFIPHSLGAMRPVVSLPRDILIDISKIQEGDIGEPVKLYLETRITRREKKYYSVEEKTLEEISNKAKAIGANDILTIIEQIKQEQK